MSWLTVNEMGDGGGLVWELRRHVRRGSVMDSGFSCRNPTVGFDQRERLESGCRW
jgi:hypothetical protein